METTLTRVTQETLETVAFLFADPISPSDDPTVVPGELADADVATASVAFEGGRCGSVVIRWPASLLPTLAANILGDDAAPSPQLQLDALGEVANVVCGNVVPSLTADGRFRLDSPAACLGAAAPDALIGELSAMATLSIVGLRVDISLRLMPVGERLAGR